MKYGTKKNAFFPAVCYMFPVTCFIILFLLPLALPSLAFAQGIVPCGTDVNAKGEITNPCGFGYVIKITQNIIKSWIGVGVIVATMGFAYAGFLYITAAGSEEKIKHAHSIFVKILVGFTLMLGAWLIAKGFEDALLNPAAKARSFLK